MKFLLVDNRPLFHLGFTTLLRKAFANVHIDQASNGESALKQMHANKYAFVFISSDPDIFKTLTLIEEVRKFSQDVKMVISIALNSSSMAPEFFLAGTNGLLLDHSEGKEVLESIGVVLSGEIYINTQILYTMTQAKLEKASYESEHISAVTLSKREKEITSLLISGKKTSDIATRLNLANTTVSTHKSRIFLKSGVSNIIDLREKYMSQATYPAWDI